MTVYSVERDIKASDVDINRRLRLSVLLRELQEASIAHTEALGMGREKTLDRGLLWVISRLSLSIGALPEYGQRITVRSYPYKTMHTVFPRCYEGLDEKGGVCFRGCALWLLMDMESRDMADPEERGIVIDAETPAELASLPGSLPGFEGERSCRRVMFSDTDLNGHMNNSRYPDWADDLLGAEYHRRHVPSSLQINFRKEIPAGEEVGLLSLLTSGEDGDVFRVRGASETQTFFDLEERFILEPYWK